MNRRYRPCFILHECGIPCAVWFEDAVAYHGVRTVVFDLYILVPDLDAAAEVLVQRGWTITTHQQGKFGNETTNLAQRRLNTPVKDWEMHNQMKPRSDSASQLRSPSDSITTVLLPSADWNFRLQGLNGNSPQSNNIFPPLPELLDALIDSTLDCGFESGLWMHLAQMISYLYAYAPELRERRFAENLIYEHRQYHFDVLSGVSTGTIPFLKHERTVRDELRQGMRALQECSASRDNQDLFNRGVQARLLAAMPNPFPKEWDGWVEDQGYD